MEITKEEFERYEAVRKSGRTNMFMISNAMALSGLNKETVMAIMKSYSDLVIKYPGIRK